MHNSEWKLAMLDYVETKKKLYGKKEGLGNKSCIKSLQESLLKTEKELQ